MITVIIIISVVIVVILVLLATKEGDTLGTKSAGTAIQLPGLESIDMVRMYSPEGQALFNELKEVFLSGEERKAIEYKDKIDTIKNLHDLDYIEALYSEMLDRLLLIGITKGLQLKPNEESYFYDKNCGVYSIQKLNKNIVYGGIRNDLNGFRTGVYTFNTFDVEGFRLSLFGSVTLTNQRIVIMGENKNLVIPIEKVLSYALYETNGILLNIENENSIILDMVTNGTFEKTSQGLFFHDTKYRFIYALERAKSGKN